MLLFNRGRRLRPETDNPINRVFQTLYLPIIRWCLRHRWLTIAVNVIFLAVTLPLAAKIGSQFMPPLYEGSSLYMPTALPGISITSASSLLQKQDQIIARFPEGQRFRHRGPIQQRHRQRADGHVRYHPDVRPRTQWRRGMTYDRLVSDMDSQLQFPGLSNVWTMPVENRLDMEMTGIKTPVGIKIQGPRLDEIQRIGAELEEVLRPVAGTRGVFAERVSQGFYIDVSPDRAAAARYGLTAGDVQRAVESGIGGANIATTIEGRQRFPINRPLPGRLPRQSSASAPGSDRHTRRPNPVRRSRAGRVVPAARRWYATKTVS